MKSSEYIKQAMLTESSDRKAVGERLAVDQRMVHAAIGLTTEAGELADAVKKVVFYGKKPDMANMKEEAGDLLWYLAIVADVCGFTFEEAMETNIKKLRARYPNNFTEHDALNRDLKIEREILEHSE